MIERYMNENWCNCLKQFKALILSFSKSFIARQTCSGYCRFYRLMSPSLIFLELKASSIDDGDGQQNLWFDMSSIEGCVKMQLISDVGVETRAFIYDSCNRVDRQCLLRMGMIKRLDCLHPILLSSVIFVEFGLNSLRPQGQNHADLHGLEGSSRIKNSMVLSFIAKCG